MAFLGPFPEKPREDGIFWIGFALFPSVNCTCFFLDAVLVVLFFLVFVLRSEP